MVSGNGVECVFCQGQRSEIVWQERKNTILRCASCRLMFLSRMTERCKRADLYGVDYYERNYKPRLSAYQTHFCGIVRDIKSALPLSPGDKLLDVGCGAGIFLDQIRRETNLVAYGIDISGGAVAVARKWFDLDIRQGDVRNAPFPPATFKAITLLDVIEHLLDPLGVLSSLHALLVEDGYLIVKTPNYRPDKFAFARFVSRFMESRGFLHVPSHTLFFDQDNLSHLLSRTGFVVRSIKQVDEITLTGTRLSPKNLGLRLYRLVIGALGKKESLIAYARKA